MLKKKHICIGGILLCISNYLFSLLFAVADLSLSKLVQIPRAPGELQANISRASELLQRSTIDFVNLLEQNFPYLSFALALAEEEREIVPDLLLSPESDVEDEFEQNFPRLSIALALAEEEREIVPDLLLSPESDVEDGLE
ncbi:MAG: hypothetical protein LBS71_02620, partial [Puniceicoccales bacterium]|nr:hypothetical protein [Puniceicoccales bacterium]